MKFGPDVLLELVSIFQDGVLKQADVSDLFRKIEVSTDPINPDILILSDKYIEDRIQDSFLNPDGE